jgi:hypothetical protein
MSKPKVIDNYLPAEHYQEIWDLVTGVDFPWYLTPKGDPNQYQDPSDNYQFVHPIYYDFKPVSDDAPTIVGKIIRKLDPYALTRIKLNCTPKSETIREFDMHTDEENHKGNTAIYYLNNNDGYTLFENGDKVESVGNRIVIFPGTLKHAGTTCTNQCVRMVLNINYIPKTIKK